MSRLKKIASLITADVGDKKLDRSVFLYMEPKGENTKFAQCSCCGMFDKKNGSCAILPEDTEVFPDSSCGAFLEGRPGSVVRGDLVILDSDTVGLVHRQVRCDNCISFQKNNNCRLYEKLNQSLPDIFDLDVHVSPLGCCNGQSPR